jgi:uncharacterized protein (TIGR02145 family)
LHRTATNPVLVVGLLLAFCAGCTNHERNNPFDKNGTTWSPTGSNATKIIAGPTVSDADGNVYTTIVVGTLIWSVENLRTTKYNDGTPIPHAPDKVQWNSLTTSAYCWRDDHTTLSAHEKWGALYNWYAVNSGKLAPSGWRVPTDADWTVLEEYLIANGYNYDGTTAGNKIAKSLAAQTDWNSAYSTGTIGNDLFNNNTTGFSALPVGHRDPDGSFTAKSSSCRFWTATEVDTINAYYRSLFYSSEVLSSYNGFKRFGFTVRLVKNN